MRGDPLFNGFNFFDVVTTNWPDDARGCILGVLDNVRGQTSGAEGAHWKCDPANSGDRPVPMRAMSFTVSTVYPDAGARVAEAIRLASPGGNVAVDCRYRELKDWASYGAHPHGYPRVCPAVRGYRSNSVIGRRFWVAAAQLRSEAPLLGGLEGNNHAVFTREQSDTARYSQMSQMRVTWRVECTLQSSRKFRALAGRVGSPAE